MNGSELVVYLGIPQEISKPNPLAEPSELWYRRSALGFYQPFCNSVMFRLVLYSDVLYFLFRVSQHSWSLFVWSEQPFFWLTYWYLMSCCAHTAFYTSLWDVVYPSVKCVVFCERFTTVPFVIYCRKVSSILSKYILTFFCCSRKDLLYIYRSVRIKIRLSRHWLRFATCLEEVDFTTLIFLLINVSPA